MKFICNMFKRSLFCSLHSDTTFLSLLKRRCNIHSASCLPFKHVLLVSRLTGYAYEKSVLPLDDEEMLKKNIAKKGKSYQRLLNVHKTHTRIVEDLSHSFSSHGAEVKLVESKLHDFSHVDWADLVLSVGGDGTFLTAASKILNSDKHIVGINSHPDSSEGSLCLPRIWYENIPGVVDRLMLGKFRTFQRQRIRIETIPFVPYSPPDEPELISLGGIFPKCETYQADDLINLSDELNSEPKMPSSTLRTILPIRALNEVFVGACMSARVSQYEISINSSHLMRQKSSGINICTGTGSSSWHYNINRLSPSLVSSIVSLVDKVRYQSRNLSASKVDATNYISSNCCAGGNNRSIPNGTTSNDENLDTSKVAEVVAREFNEMLSFHVNADYMAYSIRDLVSNSIFRFNRSHGFAHRIKLISRMHDGYLSVDGVLALPFNDGSIAEFSINSDDCLTCIDVPFEIS